MTVSASQDGSSRFITLVRGVMERGGFYWCYVAVKPDLIIKFQKAVAAKYNIQNFVKDAYGEIVVSGRGKIPPQEITDKVSQMFGVTLQEFEEDEVETGIAKIVATIRNTSK